MPHDLQRALDLPALQRGEALATMREDQWFERKRARVTPRDLAPVIIGMANAEGGTVVIGAHDGRVEGIDGAADRESGWRQVAADFIVPTLRLRYRDLPCHRSRDGGRDRLLLVEVASSDQVHATTKDEAYLRMGDETRRLSYDQRRELEFDKGQSTYETAPARALTIEDLDWDLVGEVAEGLGHPDAARFLTARSLVDRKGRLSIGGALLFASNPQAELPEALVRVLRYRGTARGAGRRQQILADHRVEGPLPRQIRGAAEHVHQLLPTRRALGNEGTFTNVGAIPEDAWLEGIVNAVIHRSYSLAGDHIRVEIFDDRLEIHSPGRFPGIVDVSAPTDVARFARNPRIARVLSDMAFGQELGEGIRRMFEEMRLAGLAEPVYHQTSGSVQLVLSYESVDRALEARLPSSARDLLKLIRELERASTGQLAAASGRARPTTLRALRALQDDGLVEWIGESQKDPRAYWRLRG
jgi:ATP-dependent DNA helicase RecG